MEIERDYQFPKDTLGQDPDLRPARRPVHRPGARRRRREPGRRRHDRADAVGGGAGEPDRPVPQPARPRGRDGGHAGGAEVIASARVTAGAAPSLRWRCAVAGRLRHAPRRRRPAHAGRRTPGRTGTARSSPSTTRSTRPCSSRWPTAYSDVVPRLVRTGVDQRLRQHRRRLVGRQPVPAGQAAARPGDGHARAHQHRVRPGRPARPGHRDGPDRALRGLRPDPGPLGRRLRALRRCCRCSGPSTVRDTAGLPVDRQASPSSLPDAKTGQYAVTGAGTRQHPGESSVHRHAARRGGAGPLHLHARRLPVAPP